MESQSETTQMVSALKLPVIVNGDSISLIASASAGFEGHIPPKTAEQKLARKNELKAKSTIMLAIPDEHLLKFHACREAKSLWEAIQNRFQKLISQLEIHAESVVFKAPKPSSNSERVPQGTNTGGNHGHKKHSTSSKQPSVSNKEATKIGSSKAPTSSKTSQLKRKKESRSAMDSNPSQTLASTPVVDEMHKGQHAIGVPNSLGEVMLADSAVKLIWIMAYDSIHQQQGMDDETKNTSFVHISTDLDSPEDDPVIVIDDNDEDEEDEVLIPQSQKHKLELKKHKAEAKVEAALLKAQPSFPNVGRLNELLVKSLQTKFLKILSAYDFSSSLPIKLNDLSSKFNELTEEVKGLKKQWELPVEFISVPLQVEMVQAKLKTLDALPSLLNKVTNALNQFAQAIASKKTRDTSVPSAGQAGTQPAEGEKNTNQATISHLQKSSSQPEGEHIKKDKGKKAVSSDDVVKESTNSDSNDDDETHVTGSMVEPSTTKKLKKFDFITKDRMHIHLNEEEINRQKKIEEDAKAEVAKQEGEGLIILKVYREDGTSKVIPNFKASNLHLGEWREVVKSCPNRTRKGWKTIYSQIQTIMDYLLTTKAELGINLDIPLREQDPLDKLNDLVNKKRKHADDIHDYFKGNKRLKSSVHYKDHLPSIVLNEPVLGMIIRHHVPRLDDHARTFSSLLLAEVDKRNLNPLKQMRTIEQLRQ
ncbi:hypothetical protein Tco_0414239 [Tanacetum coccineum]